MICVLSIAFYNQRVNVTSAITLVKKESAIVRYTIFTAHPLEKLKNFMMIPNIYNLGFYF